MKGDVRTDFSKLVTITTLTRFSIANNNVTSEAADDITAVLLHNTKLQKLNLSKIIYKHGVVKIISSLLSATATLIEFSISSNNVGKEAADKIATVLSSCTKLQILNIIDNNLQT